MNNVHEITLDIAKGYNNVNEPVGIRQGDQLGSTTIQATILDHGQPLKELTSAGFYCTKPDRKVVMNDPASVSGNVVTYVINPQVNASSGNIGRAFFVLNSTVTSTENFSIKVLSGTKLSGNSTDYLPGFDQLQEEWQSKLDELKSDINNIDISKELDEVVTKSLNEAQSEIDKKIQDLSDSIDLKLKDLNSSQKDIEEAIEKANKEIEQLATIENELNDWLIKEHQFVVNSVEEWKTEFDNKLVTESNNLSAMEQSVNELNNRLSAIVKSIDDIDVPQINADVKSAKEDSAAALSQVKTKAEKTDLDTKIEGATLNGSKVDVQNKVLKFEIPPVDLSNLVTKDDLQAAINNSLSNYIKTSDFIKVANDNKVHADWVGTQAQYDAISTKDPNTNYNIVEG